MSIGIERVEYVLHLADNALILGQRLGEWCGHGPVLEQDIAMTNIALDYIGRARMLYQYAAGICSPESTEDQLAFMRNEWEYRNLLLVERPNGDFAHTVARQFFLEAFQMDYFKALQHSGDATLSAIAEKSIKETAYHFKWASEWVIRLGDGTEISHHRMQEAVDALWPFTGELFCEAPCESWMRKSFDCPDPAAMRSGWSARLQSVFAAAGLEIPTGNWMQEGGKTGRHTEHMGYILAEMQYMQRAYPGMEW
ncbi:MAG: 1,2-phenylacetyl-CoA epoxidase, subunit C [Saprospiraceae bacterium]|jgi:ring-1,2-phenylacetyl-CoA epoxidase subunit PaaC|nr:1,2-phenylacetyl-CoA epoxidase, subunit C [Saprospiraceae bacterium]